jgi:hypothetical protein
MAKALSARGRRSSRTSVVASPASGSVRPRHSSSGESATLPAASPTSSAQPASASSIPSAARARPDSHAGRASGGLSVVVAGRVVTWRVGLLAGGAGEGGKG